MAKAWALFEIYLIKCCKKGLMVVKLNGEVISKVINNFL